MRVLWKIWYKIKFKRRKKSQPPLILDVVELIMEYLPRKDQIKLSLSVCKEWREYFSKRRTKLSLVPDQAYRSNKNYNLVNIPFSKPKVIVRKEIVSAFPNLTHLYLTDCNIHYKALKALKSLVKLEYLDISGVYFFPKKGLTTRKRNVLLKSVMKNLDYVSKAPSLKTLVFVSTYYEKYLSGRELKFKFPGINSVSLYKYNSPLTSIWWYYTEKISFKYFGFEKESYHYLDISYTIKHLHVDNIEFEKLCKVIYLLPNLKKLTYVNCPEGEELDIAKLSSLFTQIEILRCEPNQQDIH